MSEDSACTALDPRVKVSEFKHEDMQFFPPVWAVISEGPAAVEIPVCNSVGTRTSCGLSAR